MLAATAVNNMNRLIALTIRLVILIGAEVPQILEQRLVAGLLLRLEVSHVGGYDAEVLLARLNGCTDSTKTSACQGLVARYRRLAGHGLDAAQVQPVASTDVRRRSLTVSCQQHLHVRSVRRLLVDLT